MPAATVPWKGSVPAPERQTPRRSPTANLLDNDRRLPRYWTGLIDRSSLMRQIQASEAKARLAQLLDEVERGETVIITGTAMPSPGWCPKQIVGRQISTMPSRALKRGATTPPASLLRKS